MSADSAAWTAKADSVVSGSALMKINQPGLLSGATGGSTSGGSGSTTPGADGNEKRPVETIRSVISSIYSSALNVEQTELGLRGGTVAASGAFSMYYASLLLLSHGAGVLQDGEWLQKVETFKSTLGRFAMRWKIAGEFSFIWLQNLHADKLGSSREIRRFH